MKRLLLLRHAQAVPSAHDDHARALSARGRAEAGEIGRTMRARGWVPDRAVVSDARRTLQTFQGLGLRPVPQLSLAPSLYNAAPAAIIAALDEAAPDMACQLVVGHNPGIAVLARSMAGGGAPGDLARLASAFPTAALAVLRFDVADWPSTAAAPGVLEALVWAGQAAGA